jgi:hypothetical protein
MRISTTCQAVFIPYTLDSLTPSFIRHHPPQRVRFTTVTQLIIRLQNPFIRSHYDPLEYNHYNKPNSVTFSYNINKKRTFGSLYYTVILQCTGQKRNIKFSYTRFSVNISKQDFPKRSESVRFTNKAAFPHTDKQ